MGLRRAVPDGRLGQLLPIVFVGTGDKGLWWEAEDQRAWTLSDKTPAVEISRGATGVELKFNLFADKTELDAPRTIEFALLADPVKQIENERKWGWGRLHYSHNTYGYRFYGRSVDGYDVQDKDIDALRRDLTDPDWKPAKEENKTGVVHANNFRGVHYPAVAERNEMLVLYGSTALTGLGLPAFDTYGGEWLGRSNWQPSPQTGFVGWWNVQGSHEWKTPRELTTVGVNFTRSYEDCFVWYHWRLLKGVPFNGTWWDNASIFAINDYDPATGKFYQRFNTFMRHRLTKRLTTSAGTWAASRGGWATWGPSGPSPRSPGTSRTISTPTTPTRPSWTSLPWTSSARCAGSSGASSTATPIPARTRPSPPSRFAARGGPSSGCACCTTSAITCRGEGRTRPWHRACSRSWRTRWTSSTARSSSATGGGTTR